MARDDGPDWALASVDDYDPGSERLKRRSSRIAGGCVVRKRTRNAIVHALLSECSVTAPAPPSCPEPGKVIAALHHVGQRLQCRGPHLSRYPMYHDLCSDPPVSQYRITWRYGNDYDMPRKYELKRRAERRDETRLRIIEAAIEVHRTVGGDRTITAIAARSGVSRLTVYRHFPDELALAVACTGHYFATNPPPDPTPWASIEDPDGRLRTALQQLYRYYGENEAMLTSSEANQASHPALAEALAPMTAGMQSMSRMLAAAWSDDTGPGSVIVGAMGHALAFSTWRSLRREQGLSTGQSIELMVALVSGAAQSSRSSRPGVSVTPSERVPRA